jgi:hypothetical protein
MSPLKRLTLIAGSAWVLWTALIVKAAPQPPTGLAEGVFLASMVVALAGAIWACWPALAAHASRPWRRPATIGLGVLAFAVILLIGHTLGTALAAALAS